MKSMNLMSGAAVIAIFAILAFGGCSKEKGQQAGGDAQHAGQAAPNQQAANVTLITELENKLKENPGSHEILWRLGDAYFDSRQFQQSANYYKKVLEIKSGEADLYNDLGLSLHYLGNSADALRYIDEGIRINPYHQRIWLTKGFILAYGAGDMDGAKAAWEKAAALNPESQIGKAATEYLSALTKK